MRRRRRRRIQKEKEKEIEGEEVVTLCVYNVLTYNSTIIIPLGP